MKILERVKDLVTRRRIERIQADLENQKATTDYIAMMADVEIPTEEEEGEYDVG